MINVHVVSYNSNGDIMGELDTNLQTLLLDQNPEDATRQERSPVYWYGQFTQRDQDEIEFARMYAQTFAHGTDGHNRLMVIAKMAAIIDELSNPKD